MFALKTVVPKSTIVFSPPARPLRRHTINENVVRTSEGGALGRELESSTTPFLSEHGELNFPLHSGASRAFVYLQSPSFSCFFKVPFEEQYVQDDECIRDRYVEGFALQSK
jgi:hypothetical protein